MVIDRNAFVRLCLARDVLCDLGDAPPPLSVLAARLGLSQFRLIRQFRAVFGITLTRLGHTLRTSRGSL